MAEEQPSDAAESRADAPQASPSDAAPKPSAGPRRDQNFCRGLLKKLPMLHCRTWSEKEFRIDEDWSGLANLRADSILETLERVAPKVLQPKG